MAARGVSVTELAQGTLQAKRVYDAFHAGFNNSSLRIRELGDIIRYLHDILDKIHKVVERFGTVFPGGPSFRRRLEACGDFIDRHSELRPVESIRTGTKSSLSQRTRRIWQTGGQSFDSDAEKLKRALILELQRLNIFILVCALNRTVVEPGTFVSNHSVQAFRDHQRHLLASRDDDDRFTALFNNLLSVRYSYVRERSLAAQQNRAPDATDAFRNLESLWRQLCELTGLSGYSVTTIPVQELLSTPRRFFNETIVNISAPCTIRGDWIERRNMERGRAGGSRWESLLPSSGSSQPSPMTASSFLTSSVTDTPRTSYAETSSEVIFGRPFAEALAPLSLPPSALPPCKAITKKGETRVQLYFWQFINAPGHRVLIWKQSEPSMVLEHSMPSATIPYTKHSSHGRPLDVSFLDKHRLTFRNDQTIEHQEDTVVTYEFVQDSDFKLFQEDLRGMDQVSSIDFLRITAADPSQSFQAAANEVLTLWRSREAVPVVSLCFYASANQRHIELPIAWFRRHLEQDSGRRSVRLHLDDHREPGSGHKSPRPGWRASLTTRTHNPKVLSIDSSSHQQSRSTTSTEGSQAGRRPQIDILRLRHLDIVFNSSPDFERFLSVYEDIWNSLI